MYGNGNNVTVFLGSNNLQDGSLSNHGFIGFEDLIIYLGLDRNNFTSIPSVVAKLSNLQGLDIIYNPIKYLDSFLNSSIRGSLKTVKISLGSMPSWPTAFGNLTRLEHLEVENRYGIYLPDNAFVGLYDTLRYLKTTYLYSQQIPVDMCNFKQLEWLELEYNRGLSGENIINCTAPMNSTKIIQLWGSEYYHFPNVFDYFPYLESIQFYGSEIRYVDDLRVPARNRITSFVCQSCKMQSVPGAINLFSLLEYCQIADNLIETVERHSFDNLLHLKEIHLEENPIIYISRYAFRNIHLLERLVLWGTKLTTIPEAVMTLPNMTVLDLQNDHITCTCDQPWLKNWISSLSGRQVYIQGKCQTSNKALHDFLFQSLIQCP